MLLEEWSENKAKNKLRCLAEAEPKYLFLKARPQTPLSESLTDYEVCDDHEK